MCTRSESLKGMEVKERQSTQRGQVLMCKEVQSRVFTHFRVIVLLTKHNDDSFQAK